jgi:sigma-B regulation protein RsbU (phosphoserine phosphatase)
MQIAMAMGIPLAITWLVLCWYEYHLGVEEALEDTRFYLSELAASKTTELELEILRKEDLAKTLSDVVTHSRDRSEDQLKQWLQDLIQKNPEIFGMGIALEQTDSTTPDKIVDPYYCRDKSSGLKYYDLAGRTSPLPAVRWYNLAKSTGRPVWTDPYVRADVDGRRMCTYSVPIFERDQFVGVVFIDVLCENILDDIFHVDQDGIYCMLIDRDGDFIAHPDSSQVMHEANFTLLDKKGKSKPVTMTEKFEANPKGVYQMIDDRTDLPAWMLRVPIPSTGWSLVAVIPESEILEPIHQRLSRSLWAPLVGGLVMLGIIWYMSIRVTRPINHLTQAAESLAQGDLDTQVTELKGSNEIARLARTFNTMVSDLKRNVEARIYEEAARKAVESEVRMARSIQAALLPKMLPNEPDRSFAIHAFNQPAKTVAGDFFDFFFLDQDTLAVIMADVSGKGVPAALYMAVARTMLRDLATFDKTPAEVVTQLNQALAVENDSNMFVTMFLGYYDVVTGTLRYVNAGHNPPYVLREDGTLDHLDPTGPLVAPFYDSEFDMAECRLGCQDSLVLYTDGVTEATSADNKFYGEARLESLLRASTTHHADKICETIATSVDQFSQGDLSDDVTVLVLERTCASPSPEEVSLSGLSTCSE